MNVAFVWSALFVVVPLKEYRLLSIFEDKQENRLKSVVTSASFFSQSGHRNIWPQLSHVQWSLEI